MQHIGDITKINGFAVPIADCVVGGSPCQNLSVAGNRKGLLGNESQLFHEQIRIVKEMRENDRRNGKPNELISPRYMVWENVPGAFSSNKGEDFRTVLEEVARVCEEGVTIPRPPKGKWATTGVIIGNGWSIAWRVFDAQYWGVPQRRRRICLVADFNGHTAPQIVFGENQYNGSTERGNNKSSVGYSRTQPTSQVQPFCEGLSGHLNESRAEGQDSSTDAQGGFGASNIAFTMQERGGCEGGGKGVLIQEDRSAGLRTFNSLTFEPGIASREGGHIYEDVSGTIRAKAGDNQMSVVYGEAAGFCPRQGAKTRGIGYEVGKSTTLMSGSAHALCYAIDMGGGKSSVDIHSDRSPTLTTTHYGEPAVVYDARGNGDGKTAPTMTGGHQSSISDYTSILVKPVAFRKQAHPRNAEEGQGYEETDKADTLNVFDNTEKRTPIVIVDNKAFFSKQAIGEYKESNEAHCLNARDYKEATDLVVESAYNLESMGVAMQSSAGINSAYIEQTPTLVNGTNPGWQVGIVAKTIALEGNGQRPSHHGDGYAVSDKSYSLNTTEVHGVAYAEDVYTTSHGCFHTNPSKNVANTLEASDYKDAPTVVAVDCRNCTEDDTNGALQSNMAHSLNGNNVVRVRYIVRRLTPLECERLQGFPDGWTDIGEWVDSKGKVRQTSDAARYKALGNSIALPSWKWIIRRISAQYERDATMVSLFDGIGGFPLLWEQINGKGSCLWASEIDDFPMAVTKKRIG